MTTDYSPLALLYADLDQALARLRLATGLRCAEGCGACCLRPTQEIQATVYEMLPLAFTLLSEGLGGETLEKALSAGAQGRCVLFEARDETAGLGRCGRYGFRPLVCRLFGFAALRGKDGRPALTLSARQKAADPKTAAAAVRAVREGAPGVEAPDYAHWAERLRALDPALAEKTYPLNLALAEALARAGLWLSLRGQGGGQSPWQNTAM